MPTLDMPRNECEAIQPSPTLTQQEPLNDPAELRELVLILAGALRGPFVDYVAIANRVRASGPLALPDILDALRVARQEENISLLESLGIELASGYEQQIIRRISNQNEPEHYRAALARILVHLQIPLTVKLKGLTTLLRDQDPHLRAAAIDAIGCSDLLSEPSVLHIIREISQSDSVSFVRKHALAALEDAQL